MNFQGQPRAVIRAAQRHIRETSRNYPATMTPVPRSEWPSEFDRNSVPVVGCWRSRDFLAVGYLEKPPAIRLSVNRTLLRNDGSWVDGITWDELQAIKSECGFADRDAVEIYPRDVDLVNVANLRHLWILPATFALTWRDWSTVPSSEHRAPNGHPIDGMPLQEA